MATDQDMTIGRHLRSLFDNGTVAGLTDGQLLERFATDQRSAAGMAFEAIVERHGPMVLRVCRASCAMSTMLTTPSRRRFSS